MFGNSGREARAVTANNGVSSPQSSLNHPPTNFLDRLLQDLPEINNISASDDELLRIAANWSLEQQEARPLAPLQPTHVNAVPESFFSNDYRNQDFTDDFQEDLMQEDAWQATFVDWELPSIDQEEYVSSVVDVPPPPTTEQPSTTSADELISKMSLMAIQEPENGDHLQYVNDKWLCTYEDEPAFE